MLNKFPKIAGCFFIACFLLLAQTASAQKDYRYHNLVFKIDSLVNVGLPKSALAEVNKLDELARQEGKTPEIIRATLYHLKLQTYLEDDALENVITTLKADIDKSDFPVKPILQSFLADMYWQFYSQNRYMFADRSRLEKPGIDFRNWSLPTLIDETTRLYAASLQDAEREQATPIGILDGILEGDKNTRYLRPTLYDLLLHRAFEYFLADEPAITRPKMPFALTDERLFGDAKAFSQLAITTTDTNSTLYRGVKYLQQSIAFHLSKNNHEALADLDLKRLEFIYNHGNLINKDTLYITALKAIAADTSAGNFRTDALYSIGNHYNDNAKPALAMVYLKQAFELLPKSPAWIRAYNLMLDVRQKRLLVRLEDINPLDKPILSLITYRNIKAARYRVYPITDAQLKLMQKMDEHDGQVLPGKQTEAYLKKLKPLRDEVLTLPFENDYKEHSTEFKIDALNKGAYVLVAQQAIAKDSLLQLNTFRVSGLAYIIRSLPDGRREIKVVDRENGEPINGAAITVVYRPYNYKTNKKETPVIAKGITNATGSFIFDIPGSELDIDISYKGDHISNPEQYIYDSRPLTMDFGIPQLRTLIFTDRQIYRPGQTIYFKALQLQTLNNKSSIMPNADIVVELKDLNSKQLATLKLKTNEFGSAASSFVIPQNIVGGNISLSTANGLTIVKAEEYKRPTFSVSFEPFTKTIKLGDSITVKGSVDAFSGYGLSGARVAYSVKRAQDIRIDYERRPTGKNRYAGTSTPDEVATDTINTDAQGKFEFKFLAAPGWDGSPDATYVFAINADVTDANSETQTASTQLSLSKKALQLEVNTPDMLMPGNVANATAMLFNSAHQRQNGKATVEIYELKTPGEFFKERFWDAPDKWLMSRDDYHKNFPGFAYDGEDAPAKWQRLKKIDAIELDLNKADAGKLDLAKLSASPAGVYALVISARAESGDTVSATSYITNITTEAPIQKTEHWVLPLSTTVKPGQPAEFFMGINKPCKVLLETFDGEKMLSARSVGLSTGQPQKISIPVPATTRNSFMVQFTMVAGNRLYKYYQDILVADTIKSLNIKFLSMRNKLQPGEKDEWKLEITGSEGRQEAELLAGMYDASLDDVSPSVSWQYSFGGIPYVTRYFEWRNDPVSREINTITDYDNDEDSPYRETQANTDYEKIDMLGFNYYGSYNVDYYSFQTSAKQVRPNVLSNKKIAAKYKANVALVKNGFDVVGRVVGDGYFGPVDVKVRIANTNISTTTNSLGYFKIKVPANAMLLFSAKGWITKKVSPPTGLKLVVQMRSLLLPGRSLGIVKELSLADPGVKSQAGDANADIRIDEPVGNSDVVQAMEEAPTLSSLNNFISSPTDKAKRGYMMYDEVYDGRLRSKVAALKKLEEVAISSKPITIRKNFNETAFFYPQLRTDNKGQVTISFTVPEALTKWKFRGLAINKQLQTGYAEQTIVTQKQLSISANMPRFLREEDTLTVSARVANLSPGALKGEAKLELFNALTMQPVKLFAKGENGTQSFKVDSAATTGVSFKLIIPAGLEALTYRITASAGNFTDGEENTLPVLSNRMLLTETLPLMVRAGQSKTFNFDKLLNPGSNTLQNKTLTLEYTQHPAWLAVQALPYMMEFPYECSEQVFSRFYANSFAAGIVNKYPKIKQLFDRWKTADSKALLSNLEKNPELKSVLLEETPWLQDATNETEQKNRIAQLFDLNKTTYELGQNLSKLEKKQLPNGAFPWFGGNYADRYITQHIVAGIGQLNKAGLAADNAKSLGQIGSRAIEYIDKQLIDDEIESRKINKKYQTRNLHGLEIHAWYARSYFNDAKVDGELKEVRKNYLARAAAQWTSRSEFEKGMLALTLFRTGDKETTAAIIKSLTETARQSDELGMYWAANKYGYHWYEAPIETQSLMIELFTEAANTPAAVNEMKVWLLRNKQTKNWKTTKATAAACYALLLKGGDILSDTAGVNIKLDGKPLQQLKPEVKADAGTGYLKTTWVDEQIKPALGKVEIANTGKTINWGAMYWQYTERMDKVTPSNTNVLMVRKYYIKKQTDSGPLLVVVDAGHLPKTGDILKVVLNLKADRDFDYIHLKDMRPAGTEPVTQLSEYKYQDGLSYYQVTKDVATNFFFSRLNKGTYVFEYELRVVQPGNYATGVSSLQSMYAPEFNAHSDGGRIMFKE
ncbi:alpha-2-macroglobulin family protein [Mucilaginibacter pedocola]|uniref:Alpha-2-macroglobulin domain-containing protein n=1 Tax=Mucilaginibacter pedocola TaxID=1792845 RepID=A0A1S9PJ78_9SPHI|nr:alpha-2-macroglobulin family protein [Mucilaginibacter pedocola]OOQ60989.1 hypothetical protein BC343_21285 [Mucilaginibacter pedocola]